MNGKLEKTIVPYATLLAWIAIAFAVGVFAFFVMWTRLGTNGSKSLRESRQIAKARPLTPSLSPEYWGEGEVDFGEFESIEQFEVDFIEPLTAVAFSPIDRQRAFGVLPPRGPWLPEFNRNKDELEYVDGIILCQGCGRSPEECGHVEHDSHHVISVERIMTETDPDGSRAWDLKLRTAKSNQIILCRPKKDFRSDPKDVGCHFLLGHLGKSWKVSNPDVRRDAAAQFERLNPGWTYEQRMAEYLKNTPTAAKKVLDARERFNKARFNKQSKTTQAI